MPTFKFVGVTLFDLLGILFIGLKLGHVIQWSWFWVTAPIWGQLVGMATGLLIVYISLVLAKLTAKS